LLLDEEDETLSKGAPKEGEALTSLLNNAPPSTPHGLIRILKLVLRACDSSSFLFIDFSTRSIFAFNSST
jgi:hypothetical protein